MKSSVQAKTSKGSRHDSQRRSQERKTFNPLFTETDIIARRHGIEHSREEVHRRIIEELEANIKKLEERKEEIKTNGQEELLRLGVEKQNLEAKLHQCCEEQEQSLQDIKTTKDKEIDEQRQVLADSIKKLADERAKLAKKKTFLAELEKKKAEEDKQGKEDQETLKRLIEEENQNFEKMKVEHEDLKEQYKAESDAKLQALKRENGILEVKNNNIAW